MEDAKKDINNEKNLGFRIVQKSLLELARIESNPGSILSNGTYIPTGHFNKSKPTVGKHAKKNIKNFGAPIWK